MNTVDIITQTKSFVKQELKGAEGGHDWYHTLRVYQNARHIAKYELVDLQVVKLAALLHDIADSKFYDGDESVGPKKAGEFLFKHNVDSQIIEHVVHIIKYMSFKHALDAPHRSSSLEMQVVQDADRLDAMGAVGIARCFNYGGFKNRPIYDPTLAPNLNMSKSEYKMANGPSINHFYEKLLLLKDQMNTKTARVIAEKRHAFMIRFLKQFYAEWNGDEL